MEGIRVLRSTQIIILGICFAFATIVSAVILSQAFIKIKTFTVEVISVTGSASKSITSVHRLERDLLQARPANGYRLRQSQG